MVGKRISFVIQLVFHLAPCTSVIVVHEIRDVLKYQVCRVVVTKNLYDVFKEISPMLGIRPCWSPALENGWHGNPAQRISCRGIEDGSMSRMSPCTFMPKFNEYRSRSDSSSSQANTHL